MNDENKAGFSNEKNKVEAILFTSGKIMNIKEISELSGITDLDTVRKTMNEIKADYESRGSSMILKNEGNDSWKLTIKDHYLPLVHKLFSKTEMDKPLIETLAVIAWKYPVVQSEVIKIRHNKAYEHMKILEEMGFVARTKFGRTRKITLTDKFFEYFDLPSKEAKKAFLDNIPKDVQENLDKQEKEINKAEEKIEEYAKKKAELEEIRRMQKENEVIKTKKETKDKLDKDNAKEDTASSEIEKEVLKSDSSDAEEIDEKVEEIEEDIQDLDKEENKDMFENEN